MDQDELKSALSQKSDDGLLVSLSKNFANLDSDNSGSLSGEEMAAMAPPPPPDKSTDQAPNTELADAVISALDADGDGTISSDELSNGLTSAGSTADSSEIFSALDKNKDGTVSQDELAASLTPPPPPPQQMSSDELFSQLDADSDGSVSATELSSALQASAAPHRPAPTPAPPCSKRWTATAVAASAVMNSRPPCRPAASKPAKHHGSIDHQRGAEQNDCQPEQAVFAR